MAENKKDMTFEQKLTRMEEIAKALSDPDTDLQAAVSLYEDGMKLAKEVDDELSKIERRIEIVTSRPGESQDGVMTEPFTSGK
ncbi:MAG: exodeoxyribonuclease VII small subunit [Spirochaetales bacterium]|nr:exodeoxyribonuclease VII small subunit [Spirochaetales bacterium]MCR5442611.1 exodeoxyribonuclease VII small subunit [Sphaerochaetaceae bacterium]MBQ3696429.1 exodeoxyribonuclease VII small subunit [Spirochaetales bacterium]MBQ3728812.1 exodeoxyribonuclease VII small subunit [Spirochaetales bacterium]MBQ3830200.1 exodeoxyribonuclease VII small subunit [Spirochaetales bacterium]